MNRDDTTATPPSVLVVDDDLYLLAAIKQTLTLNGGTSNVVIAFDALSRWTAANIAIAVV